MRIMKPITILFLAMFLLAGCMGKYMKPDEMLAQVSVFGIELFSDVDYKEINGVLATEEPCLRGYERSFDALDVIIGYGFDKRIRKITTRNPSNSLFGIHPGMPFAEGKQKILQVGFREWSSPYKFKTNRYSITFLVDNNDKIFGITLESLN
jgi:hypothetical protein